MALSTVAVVAVAALCTPGQAKAWAPVAPQVEGQQGQGQGGDVGYLTGTPPPTTPATPASPAGAPAAHAPPASPGPAPDYGYPPPYGYPPAAGYPPNPYGFDPRTAMLYEQEKKDTAVAVILEFVIPGVGSIYAGHPVGALVTWGLAIGGVVVMFRGVGDGTVNGTQPSGELILLGLTMVVAGRIYGLVDSYSAAKDHNRALAARLGLPPGFALGVVPMRLPERTAWGPSLSFRF